MGRLFQIHSAASQDTSDTPSPSPNERGQYDTTPGSTRDSKQLFVRDNADASILVLPNPRTFLFKDLGVSHPTRFTVREDTKLSLRNIKIRKL